jgi:hypothetical protein
MPVRTAKHPVDVHDAADCRQGHANDHGCPARGYAPSSRSGETRLAARLAMRVDALASVRAMHIGRISRVAPGDTACAGSGRNAPRRHTRLVILSIAIKPKESAAKLKDVGGLTQWSLSPRIATRATGRVLGGPPAGAMEPALPPDCALHSHWMRRHGVAYQQARGAGLNPQRAC